MAYTWTICDPFKPDVQDMGTIEKGQVLETFVAHPWLELRRQMNEPDRGDIHFSPSVGFADSEKLIEISFSDVSGDDEWNFMIFYTGKDANGDKEGFGLEASKLMLEAFLKGDIAFIESKIL
jgi:hypothetical protein